MFFYMRKHIQITVIMLLVPQIMGCQQINLEKRTFTGLNKTEVIDMIGEPDKVEEIVKNTEYVFGPTEGLWNQIETGEKS